eukprot:scaffold5819_cov148-Skeletonema_menzelii.AAC.11
MEMPFAARKTNATQPETKVNEGRSQHCSPLGRSFSRSHSVGSLANQSLPHSEVEAKEGKVDKTFMHGNSTRGPTKEECLRLDDSIFNGWESCIGQLRMLRTDGVDRAAEI